MHPHPHTSAAPVHWWFGVSMTSAVSAVVIMASIPAAVAVLSWLLLKERIGVRVWLAVVCSVAGIGLIALSKQELSAHATPALEANFAFKNELWGNLLVFAAALRFDSAGGGGAGYGEHRQSLMRCDVRQRTDYEVNGLHDGYSLVQIYPIHLKDITMNTFRRTLLCLSSASLLGLGAFGTSAIAATPIALTTQLSGASEVPPVMTNAMGMLEATLTPDTNILMWKITYSGLSGPLTGAHFHGAAMPGQNAAIVVPITGSLTSPIHGSATLSPSQAADLLAGTWYLNLHTVANPSGEARGQVNVLP